MRRSIRPSRIAKLIGLGTQSAIAFDTDRILLSSGSNDETEIKLNAVEHVELKEGILWNRLQILLENGETIETNGLPKAASRAFTAQIRRAFAGHFYSHNYQKAKTVLQQLPDTGTYLQRQTFDVLCSLAKSQMPRFEFLQEKPEDPEQSSAFHTLLRLLKRDESLAEEHNKRFIQSELERHRDFFDTAEKNPLTQKQREAVVVNERANLVIAGAGSGKTSVMVARVGHVIDKYGLLPDEILLLAFNKTAAEELQQRIEERLNIEGAKASTFHALGLEIIARSEGVKPSVAPWAGSETQKAQRIESMITELASRDAAFSQLLLDFFSKPFSAYKSVFEFENEVAYRRYIRDNRIVTLKGEEVKSYEECEIANFLFLNGVSYRYEAPYEHSTGTEKFSQYRPDFYLPDYGLYLEHFGIDEKGNTAPYVERQPYLEGMVWKRALHRHYQTKLLETYSYQKQGGCLLARLREQLEEHGVRFSPISFSAALDHLNESGVFSSFARTVSTFIAHYKSNGHSIDTLKKRADEDERTLAFLSLFEPLLKRYEAAKEEEGVIDFEDMISRAIHYVENGTFKSPYRCILVDEFQDISIARARLVRALHRVQSGCVLTAVGDDWQSIYRFAGSDISLFHDFERFFGESRRVILDYTFRFNDKLSEVSQKFVEANPKQIKKKIRTLKSVPQPAVHVWWGESKDIGRIRAILREIGQKSLQPNPSVYIIGRTRYAFAPDIALIKGEFPNLRIKTLTAHASKGLEADYVILSGLASGRYGFPSTMEDDPILDIVLAEQEAFEHAEERRLFYVALTRAKEEAHILSSDSEVSPFARELVDEKYAVTHHYSQKTQPRPCPSCKTGNLVIRTGQNAKQFLGCSNYSAGCSYTEALAFCPVCKTGIMQRDKDHYSCYGCGHRLPACPECGSVMTVRENRTSKQKFFGCSSYPRCRATMTYGQT